jgi:hypothetical protein
MGPTSASEGVRTPPVSTTDVGGEVWSPGPAPWNRLATRIEFVTTVRPGTLNSCSASAYVVVPADSAIAAPGVTRPAAALAIIPFSGSSLPDFASKPGS